jgi:hypothetical protein
LGKAVLVRDRVRVGCRRYAGYAAHMFLVCCSVAVLS